MKIISIIVTILIALIAAPVAAQTDEPEVVGFINERTEVIYLATEIPGTSSADAQIIVAMIDDQFIEENFGGMVFGSETLPSRVAREVNADEGKMFGVLIDDQVMVVSVLAAGSSVFIFAVGGDDLDSDHASAWQKSVITLGMDAPTPRGFTEFDTDTGPIFDDLNSN